MDGIASVKSVGAVTRHVQLSSTSSPRPVRDQRTVAEDIGAAALTLIRAAIVPPAASHDLDVRV